MQARIEHKVEASKIRSHQGQTDALNALYLLASSFGPEHAGDASVPAVTCPVGLGDIVSGLGQNTELRISTPIEMVDGHRALQKGFCQVMNGGKYCTKILLGVTN